MQRPQVGLVSANKNHIFIKIHCSDNLDGWHVPWSRLVISISLIKVVPAAIKRISLSSYVQKYKIYNLYFGTSGWQNLAAVGTTNGKATQHLHISRLYSAYE